MPSWLNERGALVALAVFLSLLAVGCGQQGQSPRSGVIPWIAKIAGPPALQSPPVPTNPVRCQANDLDVRSGPISLGAGTTYRSLVFTNRGSHECVLGGVPEIHLYDSTGATISASISAIAQPVSSGPVGLTPGVAPGAAGIAGAKGQAVLVIASRTDMCAPQSVASIAIVLPNSDGTVRSRFEIQGSNEAGCTPEQFQIAPFADPSPTPPQSQGPDLTVTYSAPTSVVAGQVLIYTVTLTNVSPRTIVFATCPVYTESLKVAQVSLRYVLNCGPAGSLALGASATFAMELAVPSGASAHEIAGDPDRLTWVIDPPLVSMNATAPAQVLVNSA